MSISLLAVCLPIKPAPPVINTFIHGLSYASK
jgi:hypothetical protein